MAATGWKCCNSFYRRHRHTFDAFRQRQTDGDLSVPTEHKLELQKRLKEMVNELNIHLAGDYGVKVRDKTAYTGWIESHQPFHWFIEFYGILKGGGFDVIIGNPPYVEYKEVKEDYQIKGYTTEECGNLYAFTWERSVALAQRTGRIGLIIPVAAVCTDGYAALRKVWLANGNLVVSNFNDRPGKLFDGLEHIRLAIIFLAKRNGASRSIHTTIIPEAAYPESSIQNFLAIVTLSLEAKDEVEH